MKPPTILVKQTWVIVAAYVDWFMSKLLGKKPMLSIETARLGKNNYTYSSNKIVKKLNFNFTPWNESISWCCEQLLKKTEKK